MKQLTSAFLVLLTSLFLATCSKDYSYEGGPGGNRRCVRCEYLPVCDSSLFRYVDSTPTRVDTLENRMAVLGDTLISGKRYTRVSGFATFNTGLLANCDNGDYRLLFPLSALGLNLDSVVRVLLQGVQLPVPIPPSLIRVPQTVETSVLKSDLAVGGTWTDTLYNLSLPPLVTFFAGLRYRIEEKGVQRTVLGQSYPNVIHVRSEAQLVSNVASLPLNFSIDYYFARNVGLVEVQVRQNGQLQRTLLLNSFTL
jgi:hypothetical protein